MGSIEEKKQLQRQSNWLVLGAFGSGFGGILLTFVFDTDNAPFNFTIVAGLLIASVLWVMGFMVYAKAKGYSPVMGLLSLLGLIGIIVLFVLPDQWKYPAPPVDPNSNYPRGSNRM